MSGLSDPTQTSDLRRAVRDVPDHPQPGVVFKDITPLLGDAQRFRQALDLMAAPHRDCGLTAVVGIEARGFILGAPLAVLLGVGFVPLRKAGRLPGPTDAATYDLEYGQATLEIHRNAVGSADRILIVDDVLATGGTATAAVRLVQGLGAQVDAVAVLIELEFLSGRRSLGEVLGEVRVTSVLQY